MADIITSKSLEKSLDKFAIKIIKHIDQQVNGLRADIAKIDKKYDHLITTLDAFLKRLDNIEVNDAARDAQLARHEKWLEQIAAKTGVKLQY
ncbi:MAG TPA: hypothetical protein VMR34_05745 [Candidatus Saccharimonadales bacterium]|nr:hypothetical protein [Candidatus Saccharimonadales bacterium]